MTGFVLQMTEFVLNETSFVLNMTKLVLNMNQFVKFNPNSLAQICLELFLTDFYSENSTDYFNLIDFNY